MQTQYWTYFIILPLRRGKNIKIKVFYNVQNYLFLEIEIDLWNDNWWKYQLNWIEVLWNFISLLKKQYFTEPKPPRLKLTWKYWSLLAVTGSLTFLTISASTNVSIKSNKMRRKFVTSFYIRGRPRSLVHDNSPVSGRTEQDTIQTRLDQFEKSVSCYTGHKL